MGPVKKFLMILVLGSLTFLSAHADVISINPGDQVTVGTTQVVCGQASIPACSNLGGNIYCGYGCQNLGGNIYCATEPGGSCANFGGNIYCGVGCQNLGGNVYCVSGGLASPATPR